jgi:type 1 glutamine amidotransferase
LYPIENDQIPTPIWCDENWSKVLEYCIKEKGMGFLAIHCGLTDLPKEHLISKDILRSFFVNHSPQCPVTFIPKQGHPITEGVPEFTFPEIDEQYIIELMTDVETEVLGYTTSVNGKQVAAWAHELGKGKVCGVTPGHSTANLIYPEYLKLLQNAVKWCINS